MWQVAVLWCYVEGVSTVKVAVRLQSNNLDMFRASLCPSSGEKTTCYFIWSVFAGSVGCGRLRYCGATLRV